MTIIDTVLRAVERADNPDDLYEAHEALYEAVASRRDRIAKGLCVVEGPKPGPKVCVTHGVVADMGHYLDHQPSHSAQGIATND